MSWIFNAIYLAALCFSLPWIFYRVAFLAKGRRGWRQRLFGRIPALDSDRPTVWFHAVSVGELQLLVPLIKRLSQLRPEWQVAISTATDSGYLLAQQRFAAHTVFFAPLDFSWAVRRVLRRLQPRLIVLAELELWPNLLSIAKQQEVPVIVINGRMGDRSFRRYRCLPGFTKSMLRSLAKISAQNNEYAVRFVALGAEPLRVTISGNIKFDGAFNPDYVQLGRRLRETFQFRDGDVVLVAGSTQPEEDEMVVEAFAAVRAQYPQLRLVVVPRHMHNVPPLIERLQSMGETYVCRSHVNGGFAVDPMLRPIVVVDVVGELAGWWQVADLAYVGGSMGKRGGQNMIEPAAARCAVSFGPRTENFRDVVSMLLAGHAAMVVHDRAELEAFMVRAIVDERWRKSMGSAAQRIVAEQQGATDRTCQLIIEQLEGGSLTARGRRMAA